MAWHWPQEGRAPFAVLAAAALALLVAGCETGTAPRKPQLASQAAFVKERGLQAQVTLMQFGRIGCRLSEEGLVKMAALNRGRRIDGLDFLRVEAGPVSEDASAYFAAKAPNVPVHYDADQTASRAYDAMACPTYVLVDRFGHMRYRGLWPEETEVSQWIAALREEVVDPGPKVAMFNTATVDVPRLLDDVCLNAFEGGVKPLRGFMGPKGLLLVFVDTRHPAPRTTIKDLPRVAPVLAECDIPSVLVNLGEPKELVEPFYAKWQVGTPIVYDPGRATQHMWRLEKIPTVVMIDPSGAVVYRGKALWADVGAALERHLGLPAASLQFPVKGTGFA
jgi:hypothetical protein